MREKLICILDGRYKIIVKIESYIFKINNLRGVTFIFAG